ncbi:unnamed protein product [Bursaphelenchus okinawaensis]|uniref:ABC transporter domain-containing protein n=1 Tax=Bursaphelenchus okinawaensis TaxID=465554 RepID=A0A811KN33_9BILA|nr:unnamed protein product [Bursaphelenchus okinawaensis]CAG9108562.1 unnamed protein product [Bursaphelenchus okinawaensis]
MLLFAWTSIPFVYCFSFLFGCAPKANTIIVIYNIITGMIGAITIPILFQTDGPDTAYTWELVFSLIFPTYNINNHFLKIYDNEFNRLTCASINCKNDLYKFTVKFCCGNEEERSFVDNIMSNTSQKGLFYGTIFFIVEGFVFWILLYLIESGILFKLSHVFCKKLKVEKGGVKNKAFNIEDEACISQESDVAIEKRAIKNIKCDEFPIVVNGLGKAYGNFLAVKGVHFHVNKNDCFGLLGVNGAGKTSTFQMLTGENQITMGNAYIHGYSIKNQWKKASSYIGYCPQYDAVMKELTGLDTLKHLARVRGVKEKDIKKIVNTVVQAIGIEKYANRQIKTYSGGNKRRLSMGLALIGMPSVMLLDEPTTGVDPKARRFIWSILASLREAGMALVLTSHSMEECEALCTNLAIMVSGEFKCIGSPQHIKHKYGNGYSLVVTLKDEKYSSFAIEKIKETFSGAILKEEHLIQLRFELPKTKETRWSHLFAKLEEISQLCRFVDYSLSQTSLEQVFIQFSRKFCNEQLENTAHSANDIVNVRF